MTQNQINYWQMQRQKRTDQANIDVARTQNRIKAIANDIQAAFNKGQLENWVAQNNIKLQELKQDLAKLDIQTDIAYDQLELESSADIRAWLGMLTNLGTSAIGSPSGSTTKIGFV